MTRLLCFAFALWVLAVGTAVYADIGWDPIFKPIIGVIILFVLVGVFAPEVYKRED